MTFTQSIRPNIQLSAGGRSDLEVGQDRTRNKRPLLLAGHAVWTHVIQEEIRVQNMKTFVPFVFVYKMEKKVNETLSERFELQKTNSTRWLVLGPDSNQLRWLPKVHGYNEFSKNFLVKSPIYERRTLKHQVVVVVIIVQFSSVQILTLVTLGLFTTFIVRRFLIFAKELCLWIGWKKIDFMDLMLRASDPIWLWLWLWCSKKGSRPLTNQPRLRFHFVKWMENENFSIRNETRTAQDCVEEWSN